MGRLGVPAFPSKEKAGPLSGRYFFFMHSPVKTL